jgi:hypothetical protein
MRFVTAYFIGAALAAFTPVRAWAAPPAAPVVSVGATDLKQLQFDWASVPRSNYYELWFKANDGAAWIKYSETPAQKPRIRISVSVHLLDWRVARYRVAACNPSGCANSNEVTVEDLPLDAMGYVKPARTGSDLYYGHGVAVSADGKTLAVVQADTIGTAQFVAVVNVYRKTTPTSGWRREARLVPATAKVGKAAVSSGGGIALTADGNLLALGLPYEEATAPGSPDEPGAVYLFRRDGTAWHQEQRLQGDDVNLERFGYAIDLDDAGTMLAVTHGLTTGVAEIYRLTGSGLAGSPWQHVRTLPVPLNPDDSAMYCVPISLSGDGRTLFRNCSSSIEFGTGLVQVLDTATWIETGRLAGGNNTSLDSTYDGTRFIVRATTSNATVGELDAGVWTRKAIIFVASGEVGPNQSVAISRDGKIAAAGNWIDTTGGFGPGYSYTLPPPNNPSGTVFVYERKSAGWRFRSLVKPATDTAQRFGQAVALGDNGRILAVGAPLDSSPATGIDGDPTGTSAPNRGAVWLY